MWSVQVSYAFVPLLIAGAAQRTEKGACQGTKSLEATWGVTAPLTLANELLSRELGPNSSLSPSSVCSEYIHQWVEKTTNLELAREMLSPAMFLLASPEHHLGV